MLHTLARSGTNGRNSLNRHASSLSLRRTRQQQLQRSKKAGKDSDEHPFNNNATRDVANNNTFNYISDGGDDGHQSQHLQCLHWKRGQVVNSRKLSFVTFVIPICPC